MERKTETNRRGFVKYLRGTGFVSILFGSSSILLTHWYWIGIVTIYLGCVIGLVDLWCEAEFVGKDKIKLLLTLVILFMIWSFTNWFVFAEHTLPVATLVTDGEYPVGTKISGIDWKPQFTELNIDIENPTDTAYENINFVIRPTSAVAAIAQVTNISDVTFEDKGGMTSRLLDVNLVTGNKSAIPLILLATNDGYRVRCKSLPGNSDLKIVMALAEIKWNPQALANEPLEQQVHDPNYMQKVTLGDLGSYWMGYKDGDVFAPRPRSSEWLKIDGDYTVLYRKWSISKKIRIEGLGIRN